MEADRRVNIVDLLTWTPTQPQPPQSPLLRSMEHVLHRAFPLVEDEPEGRLLEAFKALLAADEGPSASHEDVRPAA